MRTFCLGKQNQVHPGAFLPAAGNPLQLIAAKKKQRDGFTLPAALFLFQVFTLNFFVLYAPLSWRLPGQSSLLV